MNHHDVAGIRGEERYLQVAVPIKGFVAPGRGKSVVRSSRSGISRACGRQTRPTRPAAMCSASAAMVRDGLRPIAFGTIAPSATYSSDGRRPRPSSSTTPVAADAPMLQPPSGCGVIRSRPIVQVQRRQRHAPGQHRQLAMHRRDGVDRLLRRGDVPVEEQLAVLERQPAVGGIARLREPRHDAPQDVDAASTGSSVASCASADRSRSDRSTACSSAFQREIGKPAVFDEDRLAHVLAVEQIDRAVIVGPRVGLRRRGTDGSPASGSRRCCSSPCRAAR